MSTVCLIRREFCVNGRQPKCRRKLRYPPFGIPSPFVSYSQLHIRTFLIQLYITFNSLNFATKKGNFIYLYILSTQGCASHLPCEILSASRLPYRNSSASLTSRLPPLSLIKPGPPILFINFYILGTISCEKNTAFSIKQSKEIKKVKQGKKQTEASDPFMHLYKSIITFHPFRFSSVKILRRNETFKEIHIHTLS